MYKFFILFFAIFAYSCASPNTDNICLDNPCKEVNRTECSPNGNSYLCSCDAGYKDKHGTCIKDATNDPCYPNPCQDENRTICNSDNDVPICLCDFDFHDENGICLTNIKNVQCQNNENLPKDSHELVVNLDIKYENNQWQDIPYCEIECNEGFNKNENNECISSQTDPCDNIVCSDNASCDAGNCLCDSGFHEEGELCEPNRKMVDCNDTSPNNSTKIDSQVEIVYTEGVGWSIPTDCLWNCNDNYHPVGDSCELNTLECSTTEHEENGVCVSNTKMVDCSDVTPSNAVKISSQVEISYTSDNGWSMPANCEWNCIINFHKEGELCSSNIKVVDCDDSSIPDNSTKVDAQVQIMYTEGSGWSIPTSCLWNCNTNFHQENNQCLSNNKMVDCIDNTPANATKVDEQVEVTFSNGAWSIARDCTWNCNDSYHPEGEPATCVEDALVCNADEHEENGVCVSNTKTVACNENTPANATTVSAQVEITYTQENGWSTPIDCDWNCNTGYHEENSACIEDGALACNDEFESNNTSEEASLITDSNSRGPQFTNLTICEGDEDWFKIESELNSGLEIDVNYTHITSECDIDLKLYKMSNGVLTQVDSSGGFSGRETVYVRSASIAETYYLKVFGYHSNCENPYDLTANIFNGCIDDEEGSSVSEQDDTFEEAVSFNLNTDYNRVICDYDDDYYSYYFNVGDRITITLDFIDANGDLDVFLYDENKSQVAGTYGFSDQEVIEYEILTSGNYFIKVKGWGADDQNNYTLRVEDSIGGVSEVNFDTGEQSYELLDNDCKVFEADFTDQVSSTTGVISGFTMNKLLVNHDFLSDINIFLAVGDETYSQIWTSSSDPSMTLDNDRDDDTENDADIDLINRSYDYFNGNTMGDKILRLKVCDDYEFDSGFLNQLNFTITYTE